MRQSSSPIAASENRLCVGRDERRARDAQLGALRRRTTACTRAPFTGLRVVATSSVGIGGELGGVVSAAPPARAPRIRRAPAPRPRTPARAARRGAKQRRAERRSVAMVTRQHRKHRSHRDPLPVNAVTPIDDDSRATAWPGCAGSGTLFVPMARACPETNVSFAAFPVESMMPAHRDGACPATRSLC